MSNLSTFFDPITGKMVTIKPRKLETKPAPPKIKAKKLIIDMETDNSGETGEVLHGSDIITSRFDQKESQVNNQQILDKKFVSKDKYMDYILYYLKKKEIEKACETYSHSQDDIGFSLINRVSGNKRYLKLLANMFYRSRDWEKAAETCEQLEAYEKAAMLYEKADNYYMAAETFLKLNKEAKAADMFEKSGDYAKARVLFKKLGLKQKEAIVLEKLQALFEAGKLYYELNKNKKAMDLLQKVKTDSDDYSKAQEMIQKIIDADAQNIEIDIEAEEDQSTGSEKQNAFVSVMEGFNYLSNLPLFSELSLDELKSLYSITQTVNFEQGDRLINQGTEGEALYIIRKGQLDIIDESSDTIKHIVTLPAGVHVGEMSLVDDSKTSATVVARGDVLAFKIPKAEFNSLLKKDDRMARKIYFVFIQTLSKRLRDTNSKIKDES